MRADPACRIAEHRSTDWALEQDRSWQCGICQPPSPALANSSLVVRRNGDLFAPGANKPGELSDAEAGRLAELEAVVDRGLQTFVEVGRALGEIRDRKLYRQTHSTFEDYCRERWGFSRSRGYRLIEAAEVAELVSPIGDIANEAQARELAPLVKADEQTAVEVWRDLRTEHGDRITGQIVKAAVNDRIATDARRNAGLVAMKSSSSHDWGTPEPILERVRLVHGGALDLDPCTSPWHQRRVQAERYFTIEDDGLAQEWRGARAFVNPPFGDRHRAFAAKLLNEYETGRLGAAIFLTQPSATAGSAWFWPFWEHVVCFCHRRVEFVHPDGRKGGGPDGTILVYVGPDRDRFAEIFGALGEIYDRRWRRPA